MNLTTYEGIVASSRRSIDQLKRPNCDGTFDDDPRELIKESITYHELIVEACEKQVPKKPDLIEDKMWSCPICDNNLMHKWHRYPDELMPKSFGGRFCMSCGQAIDWSDEDEAKD